MSDSNKFASMTARNLGTTATVNGWCETKPNWHLLRNEAGEVVYDKLGALDLKCDLGSDVVTTRKNTIGKDSKGEDVHEYTIDGDRYVCIGKSAAASDSIDDKFLFVKVAHGQHVAVFYEPNIGDIGTHANHLLDLGHLVTVKRIGVVVNDPNIGGAGYNSIGADVTINVKNKLGTIFLNWAAAGQIAFTNAADNNKQHVFKELAVDYLTDKVNIFTNAEIANSKAPCLIYIVYENKDYVDINFYNAAGNQVSVLQAGSPQIDATAKSITHTYQFSAASSGAARKKIVRCYDATLGAQADVVAESAFTAADAIAGNAAFTGQRVGAIQSQADGNNIAIGAWFKVYFVPTV